MAEQPIDLKSMFSVLRRHRGCWCSWRCWAPPLARRRGRTPPQYSSESIVLLPTVHDQAGTPARNVATEYGREQ